MASKDLQTLRMEAFTKMARSGKSLLDEITKETPDEAREASFVDYKRRAELKQTTSDEALYSAETAMKTIKQRALVAELEFAETYSSSDTLSATGIEGATDFPTTKGFFNKSVEPGQELGLIFGIKKRKHHTMEGEMMNILTEKITGLKTEMLMLQRFEDSKIKYGGVISGKDAERIAALKEEVNYLYSKFNKGTKLNRRMQKRWGTKDATTRSTYNDYVSNIEAWKKYLDTINR